MKALRIWAVVVLATGAVLLAAAAYFYSRALSYVHAAEWTTGTVAENTPYEYTSTDFQRNYTYYCPVIQFQTKGGEEVYAEAQAACSHNDRPARYEIGQEVALYYDPKDPNAFTLKDFDDAYSTTYAYLTGGLLFALTGLGMLLIKRRPHNPLHFRMR
jgi:hypothetical protein